MDFGQRDSIRYHRLTEKLILVRDNMGRIQKHRLRQPGQRTATVVGGDDCLTE